MNRRHEPQSSQEAKQKRKEVKKGLRDSSIVPPVKTKKAKPKKSPSIRQEKEKLTPSHNNKEGSRWAEVLQKQMRENQLRMKDRH